ncbi:MAG: type II toxin-antitoxin system MqsR family toxin [Wenzhouxiangellaceae bacterium]
MEYRGQKVARDIREIGFELDDVALCLQTLQAHHFKHAVWYSSVRRWHDVYCRAYRAPNGRDFELYIKLRLDQKCVVIELCSFHE